MLSQRLNAISFAGSFTLQDIIELYIEKEKIRLKISEANKTGNKLLLRESLGTMAKLNGALKRAFKYCSTGKHSFRSAKLSIDFETTISGIPCGVHIGGYYPYIPSSLDEPGEEEAVTFTITDLKGYRAAWLYRKLSAKELERIEARALEEARKLYFSYVD